MILRVAFVLMVVFQAQAIPDITKGLSANVSTNCNNGCSWTDALIS